MRSKRTIATDINNGVRERVKERDRHRCIFCFRRNALQIAHIIPRSKGGLGVEKNLVCACQSCHFDMDYTSKRELMLKVAKEHIRRFHGSFDENEVIYRKDEEL